MTANNVGKKIGSDLCYDYQKWLTKLILLLFYNKCISLEFSCFVKLKSLQNKTV